MLYPRLKVKSLINNSKTAGLPVQLVQRNGKPFLDNRLLHYEGTQADHEMPNLPLDVIKAECGDRTVHR